MKLTSSAFEDGRKIPSQYTCDGEGISPPLTISDVPAAKSLVLIMDDPDIPEFVKEKVGVDVWDHWIVFNIPVDTVEIAEGVEPEGVHGKGTAGNLDYHGCCPPDKEHRYFFKLYALDVVLDLAEGASKKEVEAVMEGRVVAEAVLVGRYERVK
jgi:Raf kinase inhibitor-like YbhB/YbcL family protein